MNAAKQDGVPALMLASQKGRGDIIRLLLDRKADVNSASEN